MTVESTIDYEGLAQEAMRGVVRKVLASTVKSGLPGDHHFYISFDTEAPGVTLSRRLKEKYPSEMTIVLQHRFWGLAVSDDRFEVNLTFDGIPERLVIPFDAIKVFFDPSVRFGLQFEDPRQPPETRAQSSSAGFEGMPARGATRASHTRKSSRSRNKPAPVGAGDGPASSNEAETPVLEEVAPPPSPAPVAANASSKRQAASNEEAPPENDAEQAARSGGAEIVSLDKFRKK